MKSRFLIAALIAFTVILFFPADTVHGSPAIKICKYDSDLKLVTNKREFTQGETILLNATAPGIGTSLEIIVKNPTGLEVFADVIKLDKHGNAQMEIPLSDDAKNGTWKIFATVSSEQQVVFVGVGESPQPQLSISPYALNYPYDKGEDAVFFIAGEPESYVYFRVIDPQGVQKPNDWTLVLTEDGRCTYLLDLEGYKAGVYTVEISTEKEKASATFTVGIQPSTTPISIRTPQHSYYAGDAVLIIGDAPPDVDVDIDVYDPTNDLFAHLSLLAHNGKMSTSFHLPEDAKTGTWKIKARSGVNFDTLEFNVTHNLQNNAHNRTPGGSVSTDKTVYPTPWEDRSPLQQFKDGIDPKVIHCNNDLVLIQKYDGTPACVKPETVPKLIERGWSERTSKTILEKLDPISELNSESSLQIHVVKQFTKPQKIMVIVGDKPSHGKILQISTTEITKIAPTQDKITVWAFQPFTETNEVDWDFTDKHIFDIVDENGRDVIDRMMLPEHYVWDDISRTYPLVCNYIEKVIAESRVPLSVPIKNNASEIFATYSNIGILPDKQGLYTLEFASLYEQEITLPDNADISSSNHNICFLESDPSVTAYYDKVVFSIIDK